MALPRSSLGFLSSDFQPLKLQSLQHAFRSHNDPENKGSKSYGRKRSENLPTGTITIDTQQILVALTNIVSVYIKEDYSPQHCFEVLVVGSSQ